MTGAPMTGLAGTSTWANDSKPFGEAAWAPTAFDGARRSNRPVRRVWGQLDTARDQMANMQIRPAGLSAASSVQRTRPTISRALFVAESHYRA